MKITIDIDCTPEEAREFMGLPDMEKAQKMFMEAMQSQMKLNMQDASSEDIVNMWTEIGQKNMQAFQKMMSDAMSKKAGTKD